jgi:hypothetical protein
MSAARSVFTLLQRTLIAVVLAGSGGYLIVYLYRWEWNRALISGVVFIAAEVAMATSVLGSRLERGAHPDAAFDLALARLREARVDRRSPFRWLSPHDDRLGVFIPVLLGAGVVLSALAYAVERLAEATARVTIDRRLAHRLALLAPARPTVAPTAVLQWSRPARRAGPIAGLLAAGLITAFAVQVIAEATQSRPDDSDRPAATTIVLSVDDRTESPSLDTSSALWVACRSTLSRLHPPDAVVRPSGDRIALEVRPGIRRLETRRLTGCLSDATLTSVRAEVVAVRHRWDG